jgi:hypothetical protein
MNGGKQMNESTIEKLVRLGKKLEDIKAAERLLESEYKQIEKEICETFGGTDEAYIIWNDKLIVIEGEWWETQRPIRICNYQVLR